MRLNGFAAVSPEVRCGGRPSPPRGVDGPSAARAARRLPLLESVPATVSRPIRRREF